MGQTKGASVLAKVEGFIRRYVHFGDYPTPHQSLVLALWALHTWFSERWPMTPYLHISAETMQSGKTVTLEVMQMIVRRPVARVTMRSLEMVRAIEGADGKLTWLLDECEKLSRGTLGDERSLIASGYRKGGKHGVSVGQKSVEFGTFCSKLFAGIGDLMPILRDRSIVTHLERGKPELDLFSDLAVADDLAADIKRDILSGIEIGPMTTPDFLRGRDREIWTPLWSLALGFQLDRATMDRLTSAMVDLTKAKKLPPRVFYNPDAEARAEILGDSEDALRQSIEVLQAGERAIHSALLVERLKALPTAGWRMFGGPGGLTQDALAGLLRVHGVMSDTVWMGTGRKNRKQGKGYYAKDLRAALARMGTEDRGLITSLPVDGE